MTLPKQIGERERNMEFKVVWYSVTAFAIVGSILSAIYYHIEAKAMARLRDEGDKNFDMWPRKYYIERVRQAKGMRAVALLTLGYIALTFLAFHVEIISSFHQLLASL